AGRHGGLLGAGGRPDPGLRDRDHQESLCSWPGPARTPGGAPAGRAMMTGTDRSRGGNHQASGYVHPIRPSPYRTYPARGTEAVMEHLSQREVAALAQGTLPAERLDHVAECDTCAAHLDMVAAALAELPVLAMLDDVVTRLDAVLADESRRRTSGAAEREDRLAQAAHAKRLSLG